MDSFLNAVFPDANGARTRIKFDAGFAPTDLKLGLGSLKISVGSNPNDAIHLQNFNANDVLRSRLIDSFEFADGTVLSYAQLIAQGFDLNGANVLGVTYRNAANQINWRMAA